MYKIELSEEELKWLTGNWKTRVLLQESATKIAWSDTNRVSNDAYVKEALLLHKMRSLLERLRSVSPEDKDDECDSFGTAEVFRRTLARMKAEDAKFKADYEDLANSADEIRKAYNAEVEHRMYVTMESIPSYDDFVNCVLTFGGGMINVIDWKKKQRDISYMEDELREQSEELKRINEEINAKKLKEQDVPSKETPHRFEGYIYNGIVVCAAEHKIGDVPPDYFKNFFLSEEMGDKNGRVMLIQCVGYNGSMPGLWVERIKRFKRKAKKF